MMHFLQDSCTKIVNFAKESDNILTKFASIRKKFFTKFNIYKQQQPHLPFTMHRLPQGLSKRVKILILTQKVLHAILPRKLL